MRMIMNAEGGIGGCQKNIGVDINTQTPYA